jgi:hypothetical protein
MAKASATRVTVTATMHNCQAHIVSSDTKWSDRRPERDAQHTLHALAVKQP